jgi:alpha-aminoadipate carrier protein LysW
MDIEVDEVEEGDVIACEECGTEFEVVGVEPLELARVEGDLEEEDDLYEEEEEE